MAGELAVYVQSRLYAKIEVESGVDIPETLIALGEKMARLREHEKEFPPAPVVEDDRDYPVFNDGGYDE